MTLKTKLQSKTFVMTAEVTPPLSADPNDLMERAKSMKGLADAVNVTDGASARAHLDSTVAASILMQNGIEPILQLTCRDRNRIALQSQLVGMSALGLPNLLVLTGDDPKKGDQPDAKPVFDYDSGQLITTAAHMRDKGELPNGRKIGGKLDYIIGAADAPVDPKPDWAPTSLAKKVAAGAEFAQTQFCMDTDVLRRYLERIKEHGLEGKISFLIGVAPFASAKSAGFIKNSLFGTIVPDWMVERMENASDPKAEGRAICVDLIREMSEIPGVAGVHVMAPLNEASIGPVIEAARNAITVKA